MQRRPTPRQRTIEKRLQPSRIESCWTSDLQAGSAGRRRRNPQTALNRVAGRYHCDPYTKMKYETALREGFGGPLLGFSNLWLDHDGRGRAHENGPTVTS